MKCSDESLPIPVPDIAPLRRRALLLSAVAVLAFAGAARMSVPSVPDSVPAPEAARRASAMKAVPPLKLDLVRAEESAAALRSLVLPPADLARLQQDVAAGRVHLGWLSLFDSDAVDGDRVTVSSLGLSQTVQLTGQPVQIVVVLPASGRISIRAVDEGKGGGVTVGLVASGQVYKLPPILIGQSSSLVVAVP